MKVLKKLFFTFLFSILFLLILQMTVKADSYSIEKMNIEATVQSNGDVNIQQTITYKFNGDYNGIYIDIPYIVQDTEHDEIIENNRINDNLYTGSGVSINNIIDNESIVYKKTNRAYNGDSGVYTIDKDSGIYSIKVYSPSEDETKTFILDCIIENLCVKHNDVSELYYNFIGGEWAVDINNLNIDIYLPNNESDIYIWGHGPLNGVSRIVSNTHANFKVDKVRKGEYVASRVMFDNSNILDSAKNSGINARDIIFQDEQEIGQNKELKNKFTQGIIIFACVLVVYWFVLLVLFEKEKKHDVYEFNEEELFKKYNPMLAGCIQGSRDILARDIIAVLLNLIDKGIINLEILPMPNSLEEQYNYFVTKNTEKENDMDDIETRVYNWFFMEQPDRVNLQRRLETLGKDAGANIKFKNLNNLVKRKANAIGANRSKVPYPLRVLNVGILIITIIVVIRHILFNGLDVYTSGMAVVGFVLSNGLAYLPILIIFAYIPIYILVLIRHKVNNILQKITGQKIVTTSIALISIIALVVILTAIFSSAKYLIVDELLIGIALLIVLTDNLMLKNNDEIMDDYEKLNLLKDKIENYTLIDEKDIEYIELWDKYLCYGVSFGLGEKIIERLKGLYIDDDLIKLVEDNRIADFVLSDFYLFYSLASLDRRFMKNYGSFIRKLGSGSGSSSGSSGISGRRRRIFWRWRIPRRRRTPEVAEEPFKL